MVENFLPVNICMVKILQLHERIKKERERLGYSQTGFAALAGASKHSQINWEKGVSTPNADVLAAWKAVDADVLYILTGTRTGTAGSRLQGERFRLGFSIQQLAEMGGVSADEQQAFENDTKRIPAEYLNRIAPIGAEIFWIVRGLPEDDELREKQPQQPYTTAILEFIEDYKLCPASMQDSFRSAAKEVADAKREQVKQWKAAQKTAQKPQPKTPTTETNE